MAKRGFSAADSAGDPVSQGSPECASWRETLDALRYGGLRSSGETDVFLEAIWSQAAPASGLQGVRVVRCDVLPSPVMPERCARSAKTACEASDVVAEWQEIRLRPQ